MADDDRLEFAAGQLIGWNDGAGRTRLNARTAALLTRVSAKLAGLDRLAVAAPVTLTEELVLGLVVMPEMWARLIGSANPYSFVEQIYDVPSGAMMDLLGGREGDDAYGAGNPTGMGGKIVRLAYEPSSNDWRFQSSVIHCTVTVIVHRPNGCNAVGAHVKMKSRPDGTVLAEGDTDINGLVDFGTGIPGERYDFEWSWFDDSGTLLNGGCGFNTINLASIPAASGLIINCRDAPPSVIYCTNVAGTHQVWPYAECYYWDPGAGITYWHREGLTPLGSCFSPTWSLDISTYNGASVFAPCAEPSAGAYNGSTGEFSMPCTRPYYHAGTYPMYIGPVPHHPLQGTDYVLHE